MYADANRQEAVEAIAAGIEKNIHLLIGWRNREISLDLDFDVEDLQDPDLRNAWNLADTLADSGSHGFRDMDGASWDDAIPYLKRVVLALRSGQPLPKWSAKSNAGNL